MPRPAPVALGVLLVVVSRHTMTNLGGTLAVAGYAAAVALATCVALAWVTDRIGRAPSWVLPALVATGVAVLTGCSCSPSLRRSTPRSAWAGTGPTR